jgi:hypothetical protein
VGGKGKALRVFGVAVALLAALAGFAIMAGALEGTGPCGRFCGVMASILNLLGQSTYNVVYGVLIIIAGLLFAALPFLKRNQRS